MKTNNKNKVIKQVTLDTMETRVGAYVWIVEMLHAGTKKFTPTVGCSLDKKCAQYEMRDWQRRNPDDDFRLRKYFVGNPKKGTQ